MVHAVPTRTTPTGARTGGTGTGRGTGRDTSGRRMPDVFGARTHLLAKWAMPLAIGLVYGYWAASVRRHGGPVTGWNLLFGFMTVLAFALLWYVVRAVADRLPREGHAVLWGAFAGSALGFLYSGSGVAMFTCVLVSLLLAAAVTAGLYYFYATRQDAEEARAARHRTLTRTT
ncbi:hypothetical protein ACWDYK_36675 [Streptomyces anthocyanicus]|uniref:Integral membrane protein n=3 Tax=Streptomyces TaxID=1883 RepID=A0ABT4PBC9_9ACTN|nr:MULTISPECIES: hypothetical protein [Streptomyces]MCW8116954.1 hypothetical protein [Streptomyces anthocyanicus]MCZ4638426.1 hypothetical protein [Streptomyces rubrogriseus]PSK49734.1 hypothetical protein B0E38_05671 [Streptomyces sp. 111WW2]WSB62280.1 hypothetical protein OIE72_19365 [Streptomyces anthocyanicus]WTC09850.1 hypothetical protein OHA15_19455 [Streptomyces anthocyanicus]